VVATPKATTRERKAVAHEAAGAVAEEAAIPRQSQLFQRFVI
jgi:hypothetical protein